MVQHRATVGVYRIYTSEIEKSLSATMFTRRPRQAAPCIRSIFSPVTLSLFLSHSARSLHTSIVNSEMAAAMPTCPHPTIVTFACPDTTGGEISFINLIAVVVRAVRLSISRQTPTTTGYRCGYCSTAAVMLVCDENHCKLL